MSLSVSLGERLYKALNEQAEEHMEKQDESLSLCNGSHTTKMQV